MSNREQLRSEAISYQPIGSMMKLALDGGQGEVFIKPAHDNSQAAELFGLYVIPPERGRKYGRLLFEAAKDYARHTGFDFLETRAANERTAKLFDTFPAEEVVIARFDEIADAFMPADLSLEDAVHILQAARAKECLKRHDDELKEFYLHISAGF